uniref:Sulfotransferase n=1 Tax=Latimeria chalumnae TaxID=7897 RepID=H3B8U9_LATCH
MHNIYGNQMKLLAVLEVRTENYEKWTTFLCFRKAKLCSLMFGILIMLLVMVSYILTVDKLGLLLTPLPFQSKINNSGSMNTGSFNHDADGGRYFTPNTSNTKNYSRIKISTDLITSKIEFGTREVPDLEELVKQEPHVFSVIPKTFLPNRRNPCWYEEYTGNVTTDPYRTNSFGLYSKSFRATFEYLKKVFWNHLQHNGNKHYRFRCLPYFYIIGQPKCGTTDLYNRLRLHPEIRFSTSKEPHWWTRKRFGIGRFREGVRERYPVEDYLDLFDLAAHQIQDPDSGNLSEDSHKKYDIIIGEASASTMWDNNAWIYFYKNSANGEPPILIQDFIHAFHPNAKLIVMLRDPVERLYSDYLYFAIANKSVDDFHEKVIESLQLFQSCLLDSTLRSCVYNSTLNNAMPVRLHIGLYVVYLLDWLTVFSWDQILILRLEDHASNLKRTMYTVFQFLNLGPLTEQQEALITRRPASNTRRPQDKSLGPMLSYTKRILQEFYRPFNKKVSQVLNDHAFLWNKEN